MGLFSRHLKPSRPAEMITPPRIAFVGEQVGPYEDQLKAAVRRVFAREPAIRSAYLARLSYGDPTGYSVGLCVRSTSGLDHSLQKRIGEIFSDLFSGDQYLDILFIREDQEEQLKKVCAPFYQRV